jgi:cytochrome P450
MDWLQYELEHQQRLENARAHAESLPLAEIDVAHWDLMRFDTIWPYFERLRQESPVYFHENSIVGPYWSVTTYDLIKAVDTDAARFSSEPSIGLLTPPEQDDSASFIAMDDPQHAEHRKAVAPVAGPRNLAALAPSIRERVRRILDDLPVGETFQELVAAAAAADRCIRFARRYAMNYSNGDPSVLVAAVVEPAGCPSSRPPLDLRESEDEPPSELEN